MAKKDDIQGVQCENADFEIMRRQLARLEKMLTDKFTEINDRIGNIQVQAPAFPPPAEPQQLPPIEVSLPDNIASREDIRALSSVIHINRKTKRTKTVHNFVRMFTNKLADNKQFMRNQAISNICLIISDLTF